MSKEIIMPFIKFISQKNDDSHSEIYFASLLKYVVGESLYEIQNISEALPKILIIKIPSRIDSNWRSEENTYDTEKAFFGIAVNFLKMKLFEKKALSDKEEHVVSLSDSYNFKSEEFNGFHTKPFEI
jgi:hypothetical protein